MEETKTINSLREEWCENCEYGAVIDNCRECLFYAMCNK